MVNASFPSFAPYTAGLLLFCLLAAAGSAARGRSAAVPTATFTTTPTLPRTAVSTPKSTATPRPSFTPTVTPTALPTFTATPTFTPTLTLTPSAQVEEVYANLVVHHHGSYHLRRRGDRVEADLVTTRSPVQHAARQQPPPALFTLPPAFHPLFPAWRRVVGQAVLAGGSLDPASPDPRPFRLQIESDGRGHYLEPPLDKGIQHNGPMK